MISKHKSKAASYIHKNPVIQQIKECCIYVQRFVVMCLSSKCYVRDENCRIKFLYEGTVKVKLFE